jgi:hypothetical protein
MDEIERFIDDTNKKLYLLDTLYSILLEFNELTKNEILKTNTQISKKANIISNNLYDLYKSTSKEFK